MEDTPTRPKVFVSNFSGYQYDKAEAYGDLIYMTHGFVPLNDLGEIRKKLVAFIEQSRQEDYLILSGHNLLCALISILWREKHGYVNILHYDKKADDYRHHVIT